MFDRRVVARTTGRVAALAACSLALALPTAAFAAEQTAKATADEAPPDRKVAIGFKVGLIPPVLAVVEVLVRPVSHLAVGVFGITSPSGLGNGGRQTSLGGEVVYEFREGRRNTPYAAFAYNYFHAATDASGAFETSNMVYLTGGYTVKKGILELSFGGGLLFIINDELRCTTACTTDTPTGLPTLELAFRLAPF